ncbi:MAG: DUF805 domain-containing protein [Hyphomicrobiaceae bacterium]|nr:DUF805 domain-containing protein [Hyphomicrobiaceae bacterium]
MAVPGWALFDGRSGRLSYWRMAIRLTILVVAALAISIMLQPYLGRAAFAVFVPALAAALWLNLAVSARRLHDRDRSAWMLLPMLVLPELLGLMAQAGGRALEVLLFIAVPLALWGFVEIGFLRGTSGANRFGPDPLGDPLPETPLAASSDA